MAKRGELRTFGAIRAKAKEYMEAAKKHRGKRKLSSAKFSSCERMPLLDLDDSIFVIDAVAPPELHLFTGIFNTLYEHFNTAIEDVEETTVTASIWPEAKNVTPDAQGGQFNGNSVKALLADIETLESLLLEHLLLDIGQPFVQAFYAFKEVTDMCFGKDLDPDYDLAIERFMQLYRNIEDPDGEYLSVTVKMHILEVHVGDFFDRQKSLGNGGKGLGHWSEQASESVHHDWLDLWDDCYFKRSINHDDYDQQLLKCGVKYNSRHMSK